MAFNRDRSGGGDFRKRGFSDRGGDRGFGGSPRFGGGEGGGRGFGRPEMHKAVCDKCRQDCEVPFRPTQGKPVYCSNCFDRPTSNRSEGRSFDRPGFRPEGRGTESLGPRYDQQFAELNSKLDKILNILMPVAAEVEAEVEAEETKVPKKSPSKKK